MIPYQIHQYKCGCRYVFIKDPAKRIIKDHKKCPIHKVFKRHIILFCEECGKRLQVIPLAINRKRCYDCAKLKNARENKIAKRKKVEESLPTSAEGIREQQNRLIDVWFEACRDLENWGIPATKMDKLISERGRI